MCKRFCNGDGDCTGGAGSLCIITLGMTTQQICTTNCEPASQTGCPSGTFCSIYEEMGTGRRLTDCQGPVGTGGQGTPCAEDEDCQRGFACIDTGASGTQCLRWCRRSPAGGECGSFLGTSCVRLGDAPGLVFNGTEYGVCF